MLCARIGETRRSRRVRRPHQPRPPRSSPTPRARAQPTMQRGSNGGALTSRPVNTLGASSLAGPSSEVHLSSSRSSKYPNRLNLYERPPLDELTLEQFEVWAIDRLRRASLLSLSLPLLLLERTASTSRLAAHKLTLLSPLVRSSRRHRVGTSAQPPLQGRARARREARRRAPPAARRDERAHDRPRRRAQEGPVLALHPPARLLQVVRPPFSKPARTPLAAGSLTRSRRARREELRQRFLKAEKELFHIRWDTDDPAERRRFVDSLNFGWEVVRPLPALSLAVWASRPASS